MDSRLISTSDLNRVVDALRNHRTSVCAGCGQVLRHLEGRHSVDGAVFHAQCVPSGRSRALRPGETG